MQTPRRSSQSCRPRTILKVGDCWGTPVITLQYHPLGQKPTCRVKMRKARTYSPFKIRVSLTTIRGGTTRRCFPPGISLMGTSAPTSIYKLQRTFFKLFPNTTLRKNCRQSTCILTNQYWVEDRSGAARCLSKRRRRSSTWITIAKQS